MKKIILFVLMISIFAGFVTSCVSENENVEELNVIKYSESALSNYKKTLDENFNTLLQTRTILAETPYEYTDSMMNAIGDSICDILIAPSEQFLAACGFIEEDFNITLSEVGVEMDSIPTKELKCYTALIVYSNFITTAQTRGDAQDLLRCAIFGRATYSIANWSTRAIAKFAVKSVAQKLVPGIGIGWAIAEGVYCISQL